MQQMDVEQSIAAATGVRPVGDGEATGPSILVIGAAGAIGRRLVAALAARDPGCVVCGLRRTALEEPLASRVACEFGVDVRDDKTVRGVLRKL